MNKKTLIGVLKTCKKTTFYIPFLCSILKIEYLCVQGSCLPTGINALLIQQGLSQSERLIHLNKTVITQMKSLLKNKLIKNLK